MVHLPPTRSGSNRHTWWLGLPIGLAIAMLALIGASIAVTAPAYGAATTRFVDLVGGSDTGTCADAANPCETIGFAIQQVIDGDTILVTKGTYTENLFIANAITVRGGYGRTGATWTARAGTTVVQGTGVVATVIINGSTSPVALEHLTVTGGRSDQGGGIRIDNSPVAIRGCTIRDNVTTGDGSGGAVTMVGPYSLTIENTFVISNRIESPHSPGDTGGASGVRAGGAGVYMVNTLLAGNTGDAAVHVNDDLYLQNVTIASNTGAIIFNPAPDPDATLGVTNTIVYGHEFLFSTNCPGGATCLISHSDYQGWTGGTGNIDSNPVFVDPPNWDYRLSTSSPARDAGTPVGAPAADIVGTTRDALPDMGAYEWQGVMLPVVVRQ